MSEKHFLINNMYLYLAKNKLKEPDRCYYNLKCGFWFWKSNNRCEVLVKSSCPDKPKAATKKFDIETGEDLKGE